MGGCSFFEMLTRISLTRNTSTIFSGKIRTFFETYVKLNSVSAHQMSHWCNRSWWLERIRKYVFNRKPDLRSFGPPSRVGLLESGDLLLPPLGWLYLTRLLCFRGSQPLPLHSPSWLLATSRGWGTECRLDYAVVEL